MKLPYVAGCRALPDDQIEVDDPGGYGDDTVYLFLSGSSLHLSPKKARRLAKAIKKAAKRAEAAG